MRKDSKKSQGQSVKNDGVRPISVDAKTAAALIGVSEGTLANWRSSGMRRGPVFARLGKKVVYPYDELEKFVREHIV